MGKRKIRTESPGTSPGFLYAMADLQVLRRHGVCDVAGAVVPIGDDSDRGGGADGEGGESDLAEAVDERRVGVGFDPGLDGADALLGFGAGLLGTEQFFAVLVGQVLGDGVRLLGDAGFGVVDDGFGCVGSVHGHFLGDVVVERTRHLHGDLCIVGRWLVDVCRLRERISELHIRPVERVGRN